MLKGFVKMQVPKETEPVLRSSYLACSTYKKKNNGEKTLPHTHKNPHSHKNQQKIKSQE